ncbi:MAG: SGNH/GDSL hydrolase family protein [Prevotella sp.]|nr:SGNH/GDSL hydrolase family protein [Prevotella sp.]
MRTNTIFFLFLVAVSATAQTKSVAVLGDSYSTFEGYITPATNEAWYLQNANTEQTDVADVRRTWWLEVCNELGYKLEINNSYSGATISFTGYNGEDYSPRSFITRADNLGCPDVILVFGGTNDSWADAPLGEMKFENITRDDLYSYRPAVCYLANYLSARYPNTDIYFILNTDLKPEIGAAMHEACARYNIPVIELHDISKQSGHPDVAGMKAIAEQVSAFIRNRGATPR